VQIFRSLGDAVAANELKTTQLALPGSPCAQTYATAGYEASVMNFSQLTLAQDQSFSDGVSMQMLNVTGNPNDGFVARLTMAIPA
jgi:hypothetical protein